MAREGVDVVHREVHASFMCNGKQVENSVGTSAHGNIKRHGVEEGAARGDAAGQYALVAVAVVAEGVVDNQMGSIDEELTSCDMGGNDSTIAGERKAESLGEAVHTVGGEHAGTTAAAGTGVLFNATYGSVIDIIIGADNHGIDEVEPMIALLVDAGFHRAA